MTEALVKTLSMCLVDILFQLEMSNEAQVSSDYAVTLMEIVGASLQELDENDLAVFFATLRDAASIEMDKPRRRYLKDFPDNFGLRSEIG